MINKGHLASLMIALRISDIKDIIDIEFPEEIVKQFDEERSAWIHEAKIPQGTLQPLKIQNKQ